MSRGAYSLGITHKIPDQIEKRRFVMLNMIWSGMILAGILWAAVHGKLDQVTQGALVSAKEAVSLCITMLGVMSLWTGILEIGRGAGLVERLSRHMSPVLRFLFPELSPDGEAARQISINLISNMLGLGWAAAPAGLKAMEELKKEGEKGKNKEPGFEPDTATTEMCTFLILNISSLQLIPVNMIAYRSQYGSPSPAVITGPCLAATAASTAAAVIFCKIMERKMNSSPVKPY